MPQHKYYTPITIKIPYKVLYFAYIQYFYKASYAGNIYNLLIYILYLFIIYIVFYLIRFLGSYITYIYYTINQHIYIIVSFLLILLGVSTNLY